MSLLSVNIKEAGYEFNEATIRQIAFSLHQGELIGLIGPNGAGKSTTIKAILGLLKHMEGEILFQEKTSYAYIPERPIFYDELTLWEHIDFVGAVEELDASYKNRAIELLKTYKLEEAAHQLPATYSKGMQQKAMIILSLLIQPKVYIIDEPFIGLDPAAVKLLLNSLEEERKKGVGILMSTHVLDTAEKVCDRFLLVNDGRLASEGTLAQIQEQCNLPGGSLFDCFHKIAEGNSDD